jgi:hypothetical protein
VRETVERQIRGGPRTVEAGLLELLERTQPDELMLASNLADGDARIRGLELVAQVFGLTPEPVA